MAKLKIKVLKRHIKAGEPCNSSGCPIALAVLDAGFHKVEVERGTIRVATKTGKKYHSLVENNEGVMAFVDSFDLHRDVSPFTVNIEVPDKVLSAVRYQPPAKKTQVTA